MTINWPLTTVFIAYLLLIFVLGFIAYRRTHNLGDYILGGRSLGPLVTALSVGASDMSGWLLLGLPGAIYLSGIREVWIGVGLVIGAWLNWLFVARPLRVYSHQANNSLTLPDFFANRFRDHGNLLRVTSALVILLFFTFYVAAGLVGGAILFESSFGLDYYLALIVGGCIIVAYTLAGGFLAVAWTDAIQALLMLAALLLAPLMVINAMGGVGEVADRMLAVNPQSTSLFGGLGALGLISLLAWGFGYVGQPHILARFMAAKDPERLFAARRTAMSWMIIVLIGSVSTGLAGIAWFADNPLENPETVFIALSQALFNPWLAGVITAAILSAIMSTIDSQLLVSSSVVSKDLYRTFYRRDAPDRELVLVSRLAVVAIALAAMVIASDRNSLVLELVSYAWAGFGAAFGPVILFSLFWRKTTAPAALAGMVTGAVTVVVWSNLGDGIFDLYEILPGFVFGSLAILAIGTWRPEREVFVLDGFDRAWRSLDDPEPGPEPGPEPA